MKFSLIICTYMRPIALLDLLKSVALQTLYPDEIIIVDGSLNFDTQKVLQDNNFQNLKYFLVEEINRGLTKQRNFGIANVDPTNEAVCFLDDDTILEPAYFEEIIKTFESDPKIAGAGGIAINENFWQEKIEGKHYNPKTFYELDGCVYPEGLRNVVRNYLGLQSPLPPGRMPGFSHGKTCGFPSNGKTYEVDLLVGMSFSFRKIVYTNIAFSTYFEGYGLYEDADYCIRALQFGKLVVNTNAKLSHFHDPSGRPNKYRYGKMVVRNGWFVWRVKYPKPSIGNIFKWHAITIVLAVIRFSNIFTTNKKKEALTEFLGRMAGWFSLFLKKPATT
jgi:GT2 family glycosyltransferase